MKRQKRNRKLVIGITGSFASGKSTVARLFKGPGVEIVDADRLAYESVEPGKEAYRRIIEIFGKEIVNKDKVINRRKLAGIVFANPKLLDKLNRIVHPEVVRVLKRRISVSAKKILVLDVPLLIEAGLKGLVDRIIVVKASQKTQVRRAETKLKMSKSEILSRIRAQIPLRKKERVADFIIDNNGTIEETRKQVAILRRQLWIS